MYSHLTRRQALQTAAAFTILPAGLARGYTANRKMNIGVIGLTGMRAHSRGPEIAAATQPPASAPTAPNAVIPTATNVLPANPSATASVVPAVPPAAPATVPPSTSVGAAPAARAPAPSRPVA